MAEHDYIIANSDGATVRADINSALSAVVTNNSKSSEPDDMFAHMWWADTTNNIIKQRNAANTGWVERLYVDENKFPGDIKFIASTSYILMDTSDGSDNKSLRIGGGGVSGDTRGSGVLMHGNEHSGSPGKLSLIAGDVTNGVIEFTSGGAVVATIGDDGLFMINHSGSSSSGGGLYVTGTATIAANFNRDTDDGIIINLRQAGLAEGNISVSGGTVSYNGFCGSHYTQLKDGQKELPVGAIVISTGELVKCSTKQKEYFTHIDTTDIAKDKRVYGVWYAKMSNDSKEMSFGEDDKPVYQIAQVGLFKIRVTDTNGNIENGDYLETSIRPMEGQRQDDSTKINSTIAKAMVSVDWSEEKVDKELSYKWKLIPCTF